jgi:hypothetical protein
MEIYMWKDFGKDPDGMVWWGCMIAGLVVLVVNMMFTR